LPRGLARARRAERAREPPAPGTEKLPGLHDDPPARPRRVAIVVARAGDPREPTHRPSGGGKVDQVVLADAEIGHAKRAADFRRIRGTPGGRRDDGGIDGAEREATSARSPVQ